MIGIVPADINVELSPVASEYAETPSETVIDKVERLVNGAPRWIEDRYGFANHAGSFSLQHFKWDEAWRAMPYAILRDIYTFEELTRIWFNSLFSSHLDEHFQQHEDLIWKVQNCLWRYGCRRNYNTFVNYLTGLKRLRVDLPDFDLRITHTLSFNTAGWSVHGRSGVATPNSMVYLDAAFGLLIYHKQVHVMTVGFAFSDHGIYVAQVQLRQKRGNRFLYKLGKPYLQWAIELLHAAYPDAPLWIVTGASSAAAVKRSYGKDADKFNADTAARIAAFYDQELATHRRETDQDTFRHDDLGRAFTRLYRVAA